MNYTYINKQDRSVNISKIDNSYLINSLKALHRGVVRTTYNIAYGGSWKAALSYDHFLDDVAKTKREYIKEIYRRLRNGMITVEDCEDLDLMWRGFEYGDRKVRGRNYMIEMSGGGILKVPKMYAQFNLKDKIVFIHKEWLEKISEKVEVGRKK